MPKLLFLIAFAAIGVALWLYFADSDRAIESIDAQNATASRLPAATFNRPEPDVRASGPGTVAITKDDAIREVPVFDGAFTVSIYPADVRHEVGPPREEPIAYYYALLAEAANTGDAHAALELGFALSRCLGYATSEQELDDKLNDMQQTHLVEDPFGRNSRFVENIDYFIELERQRFENCKGLSIEQIRSAYDWFNVAAELGNYFAQMGAIGHAQDLYWLEQGLEQDVDGFDDVVDVMAMLAADEPERLQRAIDYMFAAKAQGSLQALHDLALLYAAEALNPPNEHTANANAYANLRAASEVWHQLWGPGSYSYDEDLRLLLDRLSVSELEWAEQQAQEILRQENCCKEW